MQSLLKVVKKIVTNNHITNLYQELIGTIPIFPKIFEFTKLDHWIFDEDIEKFLPLSANYKESIRLIVTQNLLILKLLSIINYKMLLKF